MKGIHVRKLLGLLLMAPSYIFWAAVWVIICHVPFVILYFEKASYDPFEFEYMSLTYIMYWIGSSTILPLVLISFWLLMNLGIFLHKKGKKLWNEQ